MWRDGNNPLKTTLNRSSNATKWVFEESSTFTCATPEITINATQATATITCASPGAKIYYVLYNDPSGTDPDLTDPDISATLTLYNGTPVAMGNYSYIKAIAARNADDGSDQSGVAGAAFQCITPTISFNNATNMVTISSATIGSTIYYTTDGSTPSFNNAIPHGASPLELPLSSPTTIKAIAVIGGESESAMAEQSFEKVAIPTLQTLGNIITLTCATPAAIIYYEIGEEGNVDDPTTASTQYTAPLTEISGKVIKAIGVKDGMITSDVFTSDVITLRCATPIIRRGTGDTFTLTCDFPSSGVHIHYTTDGSTTPSSSNPEYTAPVTISSYPITIKAIAIADDYLDSEVATQTITENLVPVDGWYEIASAGDFELFVSMANGTGAGYNFRMTDDFSVSNPSAVTTAFTGVFDGGFHTLSGLNHALFNIVDNGTVRNVILDNVGISGGNANGDAGAICHEAMGASHIYNCGVLATTSSSSVSGTRYVGSIVGWLDGSSRVINCFSYAIVTGGTWAAGIVGYNNVASTTTNLKTMVMNCMFYGNATGTTTGTTISPVYGGQIINNNSATGLNNFNYYSFDDFTSTVSTDKYNCALGAEKRFLERFEFYRQILNSNRELATWYVTGSTANSREVMAKWVLDKAVAPYPILKPHGKYTSIINYDASVHSLNMTLSVTINQDSGAPTGASITTSSLTLTRTDKDPANYNFNYDKVQLP